MFYCIDVYNKTFISLQVYRTPMRVRVCVFTTYIYVYLPIIYTRRRRIYTTTRFVYSFLCTLKFKTFLPRRDLFREKRRDHQ